MNASPSLPDHAPRGACPSLETPMAVADGLLVRLRPARGFLSPRELALLGRAARELGNGRVEVSTRGSLQLRGFTEESAEALRQRLDRAGIAVATGLVVEHAPLAGRDPGERGDPRPLIARLDAVAQKATGLPPKVSLTVSAGGRYDLATFGADIAVALVEPGRWQIAAAGVALGIADEAAVPEIVGGLLAKIAALGAGARAKDLDADVLRFGAGGPELPPSPAPVPGPMTLGDGGRALALALPFGQCSGTMLEALADSLGAAAIYPAPHRHLVVVGDAPDAEGLGFWTRGEDVALTLCSGAVRTGHGLVHTADVARMLVDGTPEIAGRLHLHSATCAKGCGFAGRKGVRLVAMEGRLALLPFPGASEAPLAWVRESAIEEDLAAFARLWLELQ